MPAFLNLIPSALRTFRVPESVRLRGDRCPSARSNLVRSSSLSFFLSIPSAPAEERDFRPRDARSRVNEYRRHRRERMKRGEEVRSFRISPRVRKSLSRFTNACMILPLPFLSSKRRSRGETADRAVTTELRISCKSARLFVSVSTAGGCFLATWKVTMTNCQRNR